MRNKIALAFFAVFVLSNFAVCQDQGSFCPQECVCYRELTTVKCQESSLNDLPSIPKDLATQVEVLDMSRSRIPKLKSNSLAHFPRLKRLILRGSNIKDIELNALEKAPALEDLDLRENDLKTLPREVFHKNKLKTLFLERNPFSCDPSLVEALISLIKYLTNENSGLEEFDGELLRCAEPQYMKNVKLLSIIDADAEKTSTTPHGNIAIKPMTIVGIVSGVVGLAISAIGAAFITMKQKKSQNKYHYDFLTSAEEEEDNPHPKNNKTEESLASRLIKQRRQSQGYPSQDIIDSDEEEAVDQESYIKEKLKTQRRHSMGYALGNESDDMEEINLETP